MNILYLINFAGKAGTEKYVMNLMRILSEKGENCHLAYGIGGKLSEDAENEGFPCVQIKMQTGLKNAIRAAKKLAKYCKENSIDVIHAQYPRENIIAILSKVFYKKVKVVYTSHLTIDQGIRWKILNLVFTPFDHRVIAVCRQGADIMRGNLVCKRKIQVIYNGVFPAGERKPDRSFAREFGVPDDTFVMSIMARYEEEKGLPFLLASLAKLKRKTDKPFVCFIAGDGSQFEQFAMMNSNSGMAENVIQLGFRTDGDRMLKASDLYLNTSSKNEAMSFAVLEAMNAGLPLVVTDVGGNRDLAETNTVCGRVLSYGDKDGFADAILEIMQSSELQKELSDNAIKKVGEEFNLNKLAQNVFDTYK